MCLVFDKASTFHELRKINRRCRYTLTEQFPIMLALAVTIHKSQGKTLDSVTLDLGNGAFAPGQVYVALNRFRTLDGIRLKRALHLSDVRCDLRIRQFF